MSNLFLRIEKILAEKTMSNALNVLKDLEPEVDFVTFTKNLESNGYKLSPGFQNYFKVVFEIRTKKTTRALVQEKLYGALVDEISKDTNYQPFIITQITSSKNDNMAKKGGWLRNLIDKITDFVQEVIQGLSNVINAIDDALEVSLPLNMLNMTYRRHSTSDPKKVFAVMINGNISVAHWKNNTWVRKIVNYYGSKPVPHSFADVSKSGGLDTFLVNRAGQICVVWDDGQQYSIIEETKGYNIVPGSLRYSKELDAIFALSRIDGRYDIAFVQFQNNHWTAGRIQTWGAVISPETFDLSKDGKSIKAINRDGKYCILWTDKQFPAQANGVRYGYAVIEEANFLSV